ncbi:MAG: hypothetical protein A2806_00370 [Candidatus Terrybacteria bacterium RIFCSPHIGHO2_01_FULL_48_17]|uniref:CBS domain-containing protein n=1 Tax=Candidatus Terrybacteria bacterium RIFCSPHIGHO2_01_FULL_48_17 TaxID=1802362 RepID=A0A1G2PJV1_9BACT|nr:MAG: hypothetical protein A2806_00370 [Candidatus Terrybacteria bacterium RIFCSPHIGHO2_01_FULL_48_17]OHA53669.1 MAG: hypothetical protein A3A30_00690 [Candidatus Terrybacteria bacterium RIFCSPLOWO2_01_FULL_48_14]
MIELKHGPLVRIGFRYAGSELGGEQAALLKQFLDHIRPELPFWEYGDVDIAQRYSEIDHRGEVDLRTRFSRNICINTPISTAPMAMVTDSRMAISVELYWGGVGVIHRAMSARDQKRELRLTKRAAHFFKILDPVMLPLRATKGEAKKIIDEERIGSIVVVNNLRDKRVENICTPRDLKGSQPDDTTLGELLRDKKVITARDDILREEARRIMRDVARVKQLPLVNQHGVLRGLITAQDLDVQDPNEPTKYAPLAAWDRRRQNLLGVVALGLDDLEDRAVLLAGERPDAFVLDIAHGGMKRHLEAIKYLKKKYPDIDVVASNVHEPDLVEMIARAGADGVRIGIGPGAQCTTRRNTGVGGSQLTAVLRCAEAAFSYDLPVIADGGIRYGQDLTQALSAGAASVMIGTLFAGTDEAPGEIIYDDDNIRYKKHFGMASGEAKRIFQGLKEAGFVKNAYNLTAATEGREDLIPARGPVAKYINDLLGWLRSEMSYVGARTIAELPHRVIFNPRVK